MWLYLLQGIGYGFAASSQPGPFQTYLISQTLTRGWKRTLLSAFAPLISDGPIILLCLLVLNEVPHWMQRGLYIVGGLFILYLAYGTYQSWKKFDPSVPTVEISEGQSLLQATIMNLLNPSPYIFWTLVTGPILLNGWRESPLIGVSFLAGFYITMITGLTGIIMIFGMAQRFGPGFNRIMLGVSTVALLFFGLYQLWLGIS